MFLSFQALLQYSYGYMYQQKYSTHQQNKMYETKYYLAFANICRSIIA